MALHDADSYPLFPVGCIVAVRKFISVFYLVPNIWFGVDGNSGATRKNSYIYMYTTRLKT